MSAQFAKAAKTANTVLGQISRAFHFREKDIFSGLHKQYVRPHLDYAVQAWSPWLEKDKEILESVQKRAARSVSGIRAQDYQGRLKELGWVSLTERRQRADMVLMNGIMTERMDIVKSDWFQVCPSIHCGKKHQTEYRQPECKTYLWQTLTEEKLLYTVRTKKTWNEIPASIKMQKRHDQFKKMYANWRDGQI